MIGYSLKRAVGVNPFVGPRPFETGRKIFGRDREIDDLYYLLSAERIVLLHSPSGAGKSSIIQAGLIPRLSERFDVWGPTRVNLQPSADQSTSINRYVRSTMLGFEQQIPAERRRSEEQLAGPLAKMTLAEYVASRPRRRSAPQNIVLIFDQFEEILTADPLAVEAKHEFFKQLGELLLDSRIWVLFALREDYLPALDPYAEQVPTHLKNWFRLDLLRRDAARDAITGTAAEGGREVDPAAVDKLVRDLATMKVQQPDGTFVKQTGLYVEPLQLQVVCRGLWERMPEDDLRIDVEDIEQFGDVTDALSNYYSGEVVHIADGDVRVERAIREWCGDKLITLDGIRGQVLRGAGQSEGLDNDLIASLVNTHLVRGEQRAGAVWYELAHDRLIEPVRNNNRDWFDAHLHKVQKVASVWEAQGRPEGLLLLGAELTEAKQWAAQNEASLTMIERKFLEESTARQEAIEREQRQAKKLRTLLSVLGVVALLAIATSVFAYNAYKNARVANIEADKQKSIALSENGKAQEAAKQAKEQAEIAQVKTVSADCARIEAEKQTQIAERQTQAANSAKGLAEVQKHRANEAAYSTNMFAAWADYNSGNFRSVLQRLDAYLSADMDSTRDFSWSYLWRQNHNEKATFKGHESAVNSVAFSPDGKTVVSSSNDGVVKLWDTKNTMELAVLKLNSGAATAMTLSPDGKTLALASEDKTVKLWDVQSRKELATFIGHKARVTSVAISPDGRTLASASADGTIKLWDVQGRTEIKTLEGHKSDVNSVTFSPDGKTLASASSDKTVKLWDVQSQKEIKTLEGHESSVESVAFSPDGRMLATVSRDNTVRLWDIVKKSNLPTLKGHLSAINSVAFSPDGKVLATASNDQTIKLWDIQNKKEKATLKGHGSSVNSVAFSPDGKLLASASSDETVKLWDVESEEDSTVLRGDGPVKAAVLLPNGKTLATANGGGTVDIYDIKSGMSNTLKTHGRPVASVAISPDGRILASVSPRDNGIMVFDFGSMRELRSLTGHTNDINSLAFSPNGKTLASASDDKTVILWDILRGIAIVTFEGHGEAVNSVAFSPNGEMLASASRDNTIKLWDIKSKKELATLRGHGAEVYSVAFSPDGETLASASADKTIKLWNVQNRQEMATLNGHTGSVTSMVFSPDGRMMASASADKTVKLWDVRYKLELTTLKGHTDQVNSVVFSSNGRTIVSASEDGTIKLWVGATNKEVEAHRLLKSRK